MNIKDLQGIPLELRRELIIFGKGASADMSLSITPATTTRPATAAAWTRRVTVRLVTAAGEVHSWFNGSFVTTASIANTSVAGTATIPSTTLSFVDGVANIIVSGDAAAWLNGETNTLTIGNITVLGTTVTGGTSVETITA